MRREPKQLIAEVAAKKFHGRWTVAVAICLFSTTCAFAQNKSEPVDSERPAINFQVLAHRTIVLGDRAIHLNRVTPPVLLPAPSAPPPPTEAELAAAAAAEASQPPEKKHEVLFLSTTVYDRKITEVRGFADGRAFRVFSNIDFNLFAGAGELETPDTTYLLMLAIENEPSAEPGRPKPGNHIPAPKEFSGMRSEYAVLEEDADAVPTEAMLKTLDALHVYFDANKERLAESYTHRETARAEEQRQLQEHPPAPQDVVIHYWKNDPAPTPANKEEPSR